MKYAGLALCAASWLGATGLHAEPASSNKQSAGIAKPAVEDRLDFQDVSLEAALKTLSGRYRFAYRIDSTLVNERVTLSIRLLGARVALEQLLGQYNYSLIGDEARFQVEVIGRATEPTAPVQAPLVETPAVQTPLGKKRRAATDPVAAESPTVESEPSPVVAFEEPQPKEAPDTTPSVGPLARPEAPAPARSSAEPAPWPGHTVIVNKTGPDVPGASVKPLPPHKIIENKTGPVIPGLVMQPFPTPPSTPIVNRTGP